MKTSAVLLAGGGSTRMGRDKSWLPFGKGTLIEHQLATLSQICPERILVSASNDRRYPKCGYPVILDDQAGLGPLGGIAKALSLCDAPLLVVLAVDMPAMTADYLNLLLLACDQSTGMVPRLGGNYEPLAAVYPNRVLPIVIDQLRRHRYSLQALVKKCVEAAMLNAVPVRQSEVELFANWNTPADIGSY